MRREGLILRELERGDLNSVTAWRTSRELINSLAAPYRFIGREIDERWFDGYLSGRASTVRCAVVDSESPEQILGLATLANIDWIVRSAEFHIMVGPEAQG